MNYLSNVWDWLADASHWRGPEGVPERLVQHLEISAIALAVALLIALPIGLVLGHYRRGGFIVLNIANLGRAVPALAILLITVLIFGITSGVPLLSAIGDAALPAFIALVALALAPIITNTYTGVTEIDQEVVDAARGMGMNDVQVLTRVELPLALRLIMTGLRTSAVAVVATATLWAAANGGGLGRFIIDGARISRDDPRVFVGAFAVALLSTLTELTLGALERAVVPRPLRAPGVAVIVPDERTRVAA